MIFFFVCERNTNVYYYYFDTCHTRMDPVFNLGEGGRKLGFPIFEPRYSGHETNHFANYPHPGSRNANVNREKVTTTEV